MLNQIYDRVWLYHNFFQPVMRMTEKTYEQGKTRRKHGDVRTPFKRICQAGLLSAEQQEQFMALYRDTDPLALRKEIQQLIDQLFRLPGATSGQSEDIFTTLMFPDAA